MARKQNKLFTNTMLVLLATFSLGVGVGLKYFNLSKTQVFETILLYLIGALGTAIIIGFIGWVLKNPLMKLAKKLIK